MQTVRFQGAYAFDVSRWSMAQEKALEQHLKQAVSDAPEAAQITQRSYGMHPIQPKIHAYFVPPALDERIMQALPGLNAVIDETGRHPQKLRFTLDQELTPQGVKPLQDTFIREASEYFKTVDNHKFHAWRK